MKNQSFQVLDDLSVNIVLKIFIYLLKSVLLKQTFSNNDIKKYISYYDYAYYSLLGISILVLLILLHHIFGSLGIFCKKRGSPRKTCHRGIASFCLSWYYLLFDTAVIFYHISRKNGVKKHHCINFINLNFIISTYLGALLMFSFSDHY